MMNSSRPWQAPSYISSISPYIAGKPIEELAREFGLDPSAIVKLASNENPLGMSPRAQAAIQARAIDLARYPDANGFALKAALSERLGVSAEWLTLGNGSNDILELAAAALLSPKSSCVYSQYAFAVYALATQASGAEAIVVPSLPASQGLGHDLDAMRRAIRDDTQLVFIANPNNPTGSLLSGEALASFMASVPRHVVVVLDEAYNEYLEPQQRYNAMALVKEYANLLVSRSFSKAYGLAGLRVGYGVAQPALTDVLNRVRQPFNCNSLALLAAEAALSDDAFLRQTYSLNLEGRQQLTTSLSEQGVDVLPSAGNFILMRVGDSQDISSGFRVYQALLRQGVIVRPVGNYGLANWLRVSIGLPEENQAFLNAWSAVQDQSA